MLNLQSLQYSDVSQCRTSTSKFVARWLQVCLFFVRMCLWIPNVFFCVFVFKSYIQISMNIKIYPELSKWPLTECFQSQCYDNRSYLSVPCFRLRWWMSSWIPRVDREPTSWCSFTRNRKIKSNMVRATILIFLWKV